MEIRTTLELLNKYEYVLDNINDNLGAIEKYTGEFKELIENNWINVKSLHEFIQKLYYEYGYNSINNEQLLNTIIDKIKEYTKDLEIQNVQKKGRDTNE